MVSLRPLSKVVGPLPNGSNGLDRWLKKLGVILTTYVVRPGMILQRLALRSHQPLHSDIAYLAHSLRSGRGVRDFRRDLIHKAQVTNGGWWHGHWGYGKGRDYGVYLPECW